MRTTRTALTELAYLYGVEARWIGEQRLVDRGAVRWIYEVAARR